MGGHCQGGACARVCPALCCNVKAHSCFFCRAETSFCKRHTRGCTYALCDGGQWYTPSHRPLPRVRASVCMMHRSTWVILECALG
jgi:hypothetical protein